jgi:hypothetical protein
VCARSAYALDSVAARASGASPSLGGRASPAEALRPSGNAAACEELLADMWRRRGAVEHALRVANELYTEAEAAAMQAYTHAQRRAGAEPQMWRDQQGLQQRPTLTAAQRDEARIVARGARSRIRTRIACAHFLRRRAR